MKLIVGIKWSDAVIVSDSAVAICVNHDMAVDDLYRAFDVVVALEEQAGSIYDEDSDAMQAFYTVRTLVEKGVLLPFRTSTEPTPHQGAFAIENITKIGDSIYSIYGETHMYDECFTFCIEVAAGTPILDLYKFLYELSRSIYRGRECVEGMETDGIRIASLGYYERECSYSERDV